MDKYLGIDGFSKIESLKTTRHIKKHYIKKLKKFCVNFLQSAWGFAHSLKRPKQKQTTPTLDACYKNQRTGGKNEFSVKILNFSHGGAKAPKRQSYAVDYSRGVKHATGGFYKNKKLLAQ